MCEPKKAQWYAVYTRSRAEKKLLTLLEQKNVECFLPLTLKLQQRSDRKKWVKFPLIPSYLFVRITEKEHFLVLNTPGAVCYVSFDGQPVPIPEEQINSLHSFLNKNGHDIQVHFGRFVKGDEVEVISGPLKGAKGEVVQLRGKQRLLLHFQSLGCCVHIEASPSELKPIGNHQANLQEKTHAF